MRIAYSDTDKYPVACNFRTLRRVKLEWMFDVSFQYTYAKGIVVVAFWYGVEVGFVSEKGREVFKVLTCYVILRRFLPLRVPLRPPSVWNHAFCLISV